MDRVLADTLISNLKTAKTEDELRHAIVLALIAIVDCQLKTAERVKLLVSETERRQSRIDGARWMLRLLLGIGTGGGFAVAVKIMKATGVL